MSKAIKLNIDDFWNDCISDPYTKPKLNKILNANKKNKAQNTQPIKTYFNNSKSFYKSKMKYFIDTSNNEGVNTQITLNQISKINRKNIKEALIRENLIPLIKNKKKEKVIQKYINIYNKDVTSQNQKYKNNQKQKLQNEKSQVEGCSFKPEKCANKRLENKINRKFNGMDIYERSVKFKQKHNEKVAFLLNEITKMNNSYKSSHCFFQPTILNTNVDKILYDPNNKWIDQADNDSNKLFLLRYIKARDKEFNKKEKLNNSVNKKLKNSLTHPKRMTRAISQKDSLVYKKNLHNILYSLGNLFADENYEDAKNYNDEEKKIEDIDNIKKNSSNFQWTFSKKKIDN